MVSKENFLFTFHYELIITYDIIIVRKDDYNLHFTMN